MKKMVRSMHIHDAFLMLAAVAGLTHGGFVAAQESAVEDTAEPVACTVRVLHRGEPVVGAQVGIIPEHGVPPVIYRSGPSTDATGRMTVTVKAGSAYRPFLDLQDRDSGWARLVLASIDGGDAADFCSGEELIRLPDTLVKIRVRDALTGELVRGAAIGVDNVGVRLGGRPEPDRGVLNLKARTGAFGEVEIPGLAPGRWVVRAASEQGSRQGTHTMELRGRETANVELVVEDGSFDLPYDQGEESPSR